MLSKFLPVSFPYSRKYEAIINRLHIIHDGKCYANKMLHILVIATTNIFICTHMPNGNIHLAFGSSFGHECICISAKCIAYKTVDTKTRTLFLYNLHICTVASVS